MIPGRTGEPTTLRPIITREGDESLQINDTVRYTDRLTDVFRCRMEQLEAIHRWLAGYLQAVGILLQIPGAAEYRFRECESDEEFWGLAWNLDPKNTLNLLAAALERLDAGALLRQVPGGAKLERHRLPIELCVRLAERDRVGLMNIVADCLDRLLVVPRIPDEAEAYGLVPVGAARSKGRSKARRGRKKEKSR